MAWNDTFDNSTDWSLVAHLSMFSGAVNERCALLGLTPAMGVPFVGMDAQTSQANPSSGFSIRRLQDWIQGHYGSFIRPDATLQHVPFNDTTRVFSLFLGWDDDITNYWPGFLSYCGLNPAGFTRKYPRQHSGPASTVYTDGSAFANGHKSRRISDGQVYVRTAGAWVLSANPYGDAPDVVTAYGFLQSGDYIGPWIWNEIRDCLNNLTTTFVEAFFSGGSIPGARRSLSKSESSISAAKAAVEAEWPPASVGSVASETYARAVGDGSSGAATWVAGKVTPTLTTTTPPFPRNVEIYACANASITPGGSFHPQGTVLQFMTFVMIAEELATTSASITATVGSDTAPLTWPAGTGAHGWSIRRYNESGNPKPHFHAILRWSPGLTYK